jgi:hypothetical protein
MPATDEDLMRDLMHRATHDLHAAPEVVERIVTRHRRRHRRTRALGLTVTGAAAATAVGVVAAVSGPSGQRGGSGGNGGGPAITLTAAQKTLDHLSAAAAAASRPAGRYVEMKELAGGLKKTTIVDTRNGNTWSIQSGLKGVPRLLFSRHGLPTQAELDAYPTSVPGLRRVLLTEENKEQARALRLQLADLRIKDKGHFQDAKRQLIASRPKETRDDKVFSQAAYLLWNPAISPSLRSALFKVLAATPGVRVDPHARDGIGRDAVEISRYDKAANYTETIYEAPDATRVLETTSRHPATPATNGLPAEGAYQDSDIYMSITRSSTRPPTGR